MNMFGPNKRKQARAQKLAREMRARVLEHCEEYSAKEASGVMGLGPHDVANLRAGNGVSLLMLVRLVKHGRFTAQSLIWGKSLRRLRKGTSTRGVRADLITKRVSKIAIDGRPKEIARKTGLAAITVYQFRTKPPKIVSLHTIFSFLEAGYTTGRLLFGREK
jgi:hypothetical protein